MRDIQRRGKGKTKLLSNMQPKKADLVDSLLTETTVHAPPRVYLLVERKDNAIVGSPHYKERDAYVEKRGFIDAGISVNVVLYEPARK